MRGPPLDNNLVERALKKAAQHRKNSLFYQDPERCQGRRPLHEHHTHLRTEPGQLLPVHDRAAASCRGGTSPPCGLAYPGTSICASLQPPAEHTRRARTGRQLHRLVVIGLGIACPGSGLPHAHIPRLCGRRQLLRPHDDNDFFPAYRCPARSARPAAVAHCYGVEPGVGCRVDGARLATHAVMAGTDLPGTV